MQQCTAPPPSLLSKMGQLFWPVHRNEYRSFLPLFLLSFLITLVYNLGKSLKITLLVTAPGSSPEVLPFVQSWGVMPASIGIAILYFYLINRYSRESVFIGITLIFMGFFLSFIGILYPNRTALEPKWLLDILASNLPETLKGFILMIKLWPLSLFYILIELWTTTLYATLFWGLANETTTMNQAKRFYPLFSFAANCTGILAAPLVVLLTLKNPIKLLSFAGEAWEQSLTLYIIAMLCTSGLVILAVLFAVRQNQSATVHLASHQPKSKLSLMVSLRKILHDRQLLAIAILVITYNWVYNLSEIILLHYLHIKFPRPVEFNNYLNFISMLTGVMASIAALALSGNILRHYGWRVAAWISPVVWGLTGLIFFACVYFETVAKIYHLPLLGTIALIFGSAQYCLGRACKYSFFDDTKEMAFIPLSKEVQRQGKAAIDGVGGRLGKASSAWLCQILFVGFHGISNAIPTMMVLVFLALAGWLWAVEKLNTNLRKITENSA